MKASRLVLLHELSLLGTQLVVAVVIDKSSGNTSVISCATGISRILGSSTLAFIRALVAPKACSFMLCDLDFEPLSLSLSSLPSCDLVSLTNMLILLHYLESFKSELAEVFVFQS
ncbi:hypothetical protein Tco_0269053 [Tanacetum coccineum]